MLGRSQMKLRVKIFLILMAGFLPVPGWCTSAVGPRMKEYFRDAFLPHLWAGTKASFGEPMNWVWLGLGGGLAIVAHQYDWQVNDYWEEHKMDYGLADVGNTWGSGEIPAAVAVSMMFLGWQIGNEKVATTGEVLAEALIIQGLVIAVIKPLAGKERPDGSDNLSFPSGHTGCAFATAAVLHDRLGWKVGVPAYALALITGLARMDVNDHWLSDVVMAATIGMVVGYSVSRHHDDYPYELPANKPRVRLAPLFDGKYSGLLFIASW